MKDKKNINLENIADEIYKIETNISYKNEEEKEIAMLKLLKSLSSFEDILEIDEIINEKYLTK